MRIKLNCLFPALIGGLLLATSVGASLAKAAALPSFRASNISSRQLPLIADLDGDGRDDLVVADRNELSFYYQNPDGTYPAEPAQKYVLAPRPALLCAGAVQGAAASVFVLSNEGVEELNAAQRSQPPVHRQLLTVPIPLPDLANSNQVANFPFFARGRQHDPMLLLPTVDGLLIYTWQGQWNSGQLITGLTEPLRVPRLSQQGYQQNLRLGWSLQDLHGSNYDDLLVKTPGPDNQEIFTRYEQDASQIFHPTLVYTNTPDPRSAVYWTDLAGTQGLDLVKVSPTDEPSFIPGLRSGKVTVAIHRAGPDGRVPTAPTELFRKSDWSTGLPLVDLDGDGQKDLVLGFIPIDSREGIRNMMLAREIRLTLKFYFGRHAGNFPKDPDLQRTLPVHLDRETFFDQQQKLYYGRALSFQGDFDGDGKKDLLVRDQKDKISVYRFLSPTAGFSPKPDRQFDCSESILWWKVVDLNHDGVSDLLVKLAEGSQLRIFTSQPH